MRLLDLFCYPGGAGVGYHRAGFEVVGVDLYGGADYPFEFHQADALTFPLEGFDAIHASPPCEAFVQWQGINRARNGSVPEHPDLIPPIRERLVRSGLPYVIENVVGAPLLDPVMLCGSWFGLNVTRHRLFESNVLLLRQRGCQHTGREIAVYGKLDGRRIWTRADGSEVRAASTVEEAQEALGIDWCSDWDRLKKAIPPAFTEFLGQQLASYVKAAA